MPALLFLENKPKILPGHAFIFYNIRYNFAEDILKNGQGTKV